MLKENMKATGEMNKNKIQIRMFCFFLLNDISLYDVTQISIPHAMIYMLFIYLFILGIRVYVFLCVRY